jgi:lipopolysaccharide transport system ATP-binding protein
MTQKHMISAQDLGKRYQIRHQAQRYLSLREELSNAVSRLLRRPSAPGQPNTGATKEDFWALKDVNFVVEQGDRLGIIGRNGAGKSTLLKILSRITDPTEGRVRISGRVSSLLEVGTGFHPELSGRENIFLNGSILGMRADEISRKFDQIVDFAEIERFLDTPVKRYSSGMYVRLAFAVAAHLEPDILVVDEVLAVGDAQFQAKCLGRMEELSKTGRTILFVTHNMDAMLSLCNRGLVLEKGQVIFDGLPLEAREKYMLSVSSAEYSVRRNAGRGGSGGVTIEHVWVTMEGNEPTTVESGSAVSICLTAQVGEDYRGRLDLQVAYGLDTIEGQRLYTVLSSWAGEPVETSEGTIRVACDIASLPLIPGKYLISATVLFRGDTLDSVQHCAMLDIVPRKRAIHVERMHGWGPLDLPSEFHNLDW